MIIAIPAYGRINLLGQVVDYYHAMGYTPIVVASPYKDGSIWDRADATVPNSPLGSKFNDCIELGWKSCGKDDGVVICGSDTLLSPVALRYLEKSPAPLTELVGCHFYFPKDDRMLFYTEFLCGPGKKMSGELLRRCGGRPYREEAEKNLDKWPKVWLTSPAEGVRIRTGIDVPLCVEIREGPSMTDLNDIKEEPVECDPDIIFGQMGPVGQKMRS